MHHISSTYLAILLALFCLHASLSQADSTTTEEKPSPEQLESIMQKLEQSTKQREQQNTRVEALSRRLECNWTLIRTYETCEKLHKNNPDEHLKCSTIAKQNAARCLENVEEK
jgi:septal ring factor EnvC (AmiA/AmiB activator)